MTRRRTDNIDGVRILGAWGANEEIIRFDVTINERLVVDCLHASQLMSRSIRHYKTRDARRKRPLHAETLNIPFAVPTCTHT